MTSSGARIRSYLQTQTDRFISTGRAILCVFFLVAVVLDPAPSSGAVLGGYTLYTLVLSVLERCRWIERERLGVLSRLVDLLLFAPVIFLIEGPSAASSVYFIFLLVSSALRRQVTFYTVAATLVVVLAVALYPLPLLEDPGNLLIRGARMVALAFLLGCLGVHLQSLLKVLSLLAEWPNAAVDDLRSLGGKTLAHAAAILRTPRIVLLVEEEEEPWLHVVSWSSESCDYRREPPAELSLMVRVAASVDALCCSDAARLGAHVLEHGAGGFRKRVLPPLASELLERFAVRSLLLARLEGTGFAGYLLALDRTPMTEDDLVLAEIVGSAVAAQLENVFLNNQLQEGAAMGERISLARDLHDGLLQSMAGAALDLERAHRLMDTDTRKAQQLIQEVQQQVALEQRDLREQVTRLRGGGGTSAPFDLELRLRELAERIKRQWNLEVEFEGPPALPAHAEGMGREIYLVVHEALMNAVRHAGASSLRVQIAITEDEAAITVADNGHGFAFRGVYDHRALSALKVGPASLRERVTALRGRLSVSSRKNGANLEITLPFSHGDGYPGTAAH